MTGRHGDGVVAGAAEGLRAVVRVVVDHPVAVTMVFLALGVFGFVAYSRLPVELMPDIGYPTLTVRTAYDGAAPQELEAQVSKPIESQLATLDGLVSLESRSRAGRSDVVLGFDWGSDLAAASQAIREKLQLVPLPDDADRPLLLRYDPSLEPFLRIGLSMEGSVAAADATSSDATLPDDAAAQLVTLRSIAEREVQRRLEAMPGVAAVRIRGGLEREIRVEVREDWLAARRLTVDDVERALSTENVDFAGGSLLDGDVEYLVRTLNAYTTADDVRALRIRRSDGTLVRLTEVARVRETHRERDVVSLLDGSEAVELEVYKEADANLVAVADGVKSAIDGEGGLRASLPTGVSLRVLDDQAAFVRAAITNLRDTALLGGLFAVAVLFLFLRNLRATGIIGLAIPVSVVVAFAPLYLAEVTLNLMSLGGLALGIGMLVDNAVVVLEAIQRHLDEGMDTADAAVVGTAEVAGAVTASTLTTVAVFAPIAFVEGVAGELFGDLSLAVVSSLVASLAVALTLVPMLAALRWDLDATGSGGALEALSEREPLEVARAAWSRSWRGTVDPLRAWFVGEQGPGGAWRWVLAPWPVVRALLGGLAALITTPALLLSAVLARLAWRGFRPLLGLVGWALFRAADAFQAVYGRLATGYADTLPGLLRRTGGVLAAAAVLAVATWAASGWLGSSLLPEVHQGRFTLAAALPVGTPLPTTLDVVKVLERRVRAHPEVATVYTTVGSDGSADEEAGAGPHTARLRVELTPGGDRALRERRVIEQLREVAAAVPRIGVQVTRPSLFTFRTPVEVVLRGYELERLKAAGDATVQALSALPGLRDVTTSLVPGNPEVRVVYDREAIARFGLNVRSVAEAVRDKVQGTEATSLRQGDDRLEVRVQLAEAQRSTLGDLARLNVNPQLVPPIPLSSVATLSEAEGPSEIRRVDQERAVVVSADVAGFDLGAAGEAIEATLAGTPLPRGIRWEVAGQSAEMQGSLASLGFALALAVFLVYVIMASTFEDVVQPLLILVSVPLAAIGVALTLLVAGLPVSVVVLIGAIVLAGVVVNNAIVLVDTINRLRDEPTADGSPRDLLDAVVEGARLRLRPILVTTTTTVLGLLPLAFGLGEGAEIQQPLAVTVIGGLTSSTLLTLVFLPALTLAAGRLRR